MIKVLVFSQELNQEPRGKPARPLRAGPRGMSRWFGRKILLKIRGIPNHRDGELNPQ